MDKKRTDEKTDISPSSLRQRAEAQSAHTPPPTHPSSPEENQKVLHELRVHQIELEMQNEDLRQSQAELAASQARYFDLYDLAPVGYLSLSAAGLILEANLAVSVLLGVARSALATQPFSRFILKEDQDRYYLFRKQLVVDHAPLPLELRMVKTDGTAFWAHLTLCTTLAPSTDSGQTPANKLIYRIVLEDISERKRAEVTRQESIDLLNTVVDNIPLMLFLKEATDLRVVLFNRAGEELLGRDRTSLLGKTNLDLFPAEQAAFFMAKDREALDSTIGVVDIPEESMLTAKKGQRLLHTRKVCVRGSDGTTKYLLGISEDITDRKRAEDELARQLDELRRWQTVTLGREGRIRELKHEVNALAKRLGEKPPYAEKAP
jgi:PAS domain S-box-containing protein